MGTILYSTNKQRKEYNNYDNTKMTKSLEYKIQVLNKKLDLILKTLGKF
jgi:hypothetical protein